MVHSTLIAEYPHTLMSARDEALSDRWDKFLVPGSSDNCCLRVSSRFRRLQKRGSSTLQTEDGMLSGRSLVGP